MSLFDLSGKVAIITGSSRGIGRAIAERLAEHGAKVVVSSRKAEACKEVADAINKKHGKDRAIVVPANISSKDDLKNLIEETNKQLGPIDILVSNHWLVQFAAPQMIKRKSGSIIIISSIGGLRGSSMLGAYCISKAADFQL